MPTDKKAHAKRQQAYYSMKQKTHTRICFWVRRDEVEVFRKAAESKLASLDRGRK